MKLEQDYFDKKSNVPQYRLAMCCGILKILIICKTKVSMTEQFGYLCKVAIFIMSYHVMTMISVLVAKSQDVSLNEDGRTLRRYLQETSLYDITDIKHS
jgi:hypothetical protein